MQTTVIAAVSLVIAFSCLLLAILFFCGTFQEVKDRAEEEATEFRETAGHIQPITTQDITWL